MAGPRDAEQLGDLGDGVVAAGVHMAGEIVTDVTPGLSGRRCGARAAGLGYAAFAPHDAVGFAP